MLSVIMLNVTNNPFMLSVVLLNVVLLNVVAPAPGLVFTNILTNFLQ